MTTMTTTTTQQVVATYAAAMDAAAAALRAVAKGTEAYPAALTTYYAVVKAAKVTYDRDFAAAVLAERQAPARREGREGREVRGHMIDEGEDN